MYYHDCTACNKSWKTRTRNKMRRLAARHWNEDHDDHIDRMEVIDRVQIRGDIIDTPEGKVKQIQEREVRLTPFDIRSGRTAYGYVDDAYVNPSDDDRVCDFCGIGLNDETGRTAYKEVKREANGYACDKCFEREDIEYADPAPDSTPKDDKERAALLWQEHEDVGEVADELEVPRKKARDLLNEAGVAMRPMPSDEDSKLTEFAEAEN